VVLDSDHDVISASVKLIGIMEPVSESWNKCFSSTCDLGPRDINTDMRIVSSRAKSVGKAVNLAQWISPHFHTSRLRSIEDSIPPKRILPYGRSICDHLGPEISHAHRGIAGKVFLPQSRIPRSSTRVKKWYHQSKSSLVAK